MTQTDQATAQIRAHALRGPWHAFLVDSEDTVIDDPASVTHTAGRFATTVVRGSALPIGASGFGYVLPRGFDVGDVAYIRGCVGLRVALVDYERAQAMAAGLNAASAALTPAEALPAPVDQHGEWRRYAFGVAVSPSETTPYRFDVEIDGAETRYAQTTEQVEAVVRAYAELAALSATPADAQATPTPVNVTGEAVAHCPDCDIAVPIGEITDEGRHAECGAFVQPA